MAPVPVDVVALARAANRTDAAWTAAVRGLAPSSRREVLAEADRLADGGDRARSADVYEILAIDLDPLLQVDARRIRRLVEERRATFPSLEDLFVRAAAGSVDPALALEAEAISAQHAVNRGDRPAADRAYLDLFAKVRGRGDRIEAVAYVNFARYCLSSGREFEALAASRRAEALFRGLDHAWGLSLAVLHRGAVVQNLRDWTRLDATITEVEAILPRLGAREAAQVRVTLHDRRAHAAWARGRTDEALRHVDEGERLAAEIVIQPSAFGDPRISASLRVLVLVAGRRPAEALGIADEALPKGPRHDGQGFFLRVARLEAHVAEAGAADPEVETEAAAILDDLHAYAGTLSPGRVRELAAGVAHSLASVPSAIRTMRRAFDVAATAAFQRAIEVDRFVRTMPDASELTAEDAETLDEHRLYTLAEQAALGSAVARALERAAEEGRSPLPMFGDADGLTCVCAWCQRVRTKDGVWLSVQQFLPLRSAGPVQLTHGICDACSGDLTAQAAAIGR